MSVKEHSANGLNLKRRRIKHMKRVLVVDDDGVLRTDLALSLTEWGYDVRTAAGGLEGVRLINGWQPDLVLCDVRMPNIAGSEVRRYLNNMRSIYSGMKFFFISATPEAELESLSRWEGVDDWLVKPIQIDLLKQKIEHHLKPKNAIIGADGGLWPVIVVTVLLLVAIALRRYVQT